MPKNDGSEERELHDLTRMRNARLRREVSLMGAQAEDLGRQLRGAITIVDLLTTSLGRVLQDCTVSEAMIRVEAEDTLAVARFYLKTGQLAKGDQDDAEQGS